MVAGPVMVAAPASNVRREILASVCRGLWVCIQPSSELSECKIKSSTCGITSVSRFLVFACGGISVCPGINV